MSCQGLRNNIRDNWAELVGLKSKPITRKEHYDLYEKGTNKRPLCFKIGQVYRMLPTRASHVTKPYYVIIKDVGVKHIITDIPKEHSLTITYGTATWNYHMNRMEYIGDDASCKKLILNQDLD